MALRKIDRVLAPVTWAIAAFVVLALLVGPELIGAKKPASARAAASGEAVFESSCAGCHTLKAAGSTAKVGPDLGKLENADAAFIRRSIVDPSAEVEEGFQDGVMPQNFGKQLSKEELDALVKYLLESQE